MVCTVSMVRTIFTVRTVFACSLLVLVAASAGCRMCASPYDYCGPTSTGECGQGCCPNARQGSILSPGAQPMQYEMQPAPGMEPTLAASIQSGEAKRMPGVEEPVGQIDVAVWNPLAGRSPR